MIGKATVLNDIDTKNVLNSIKTQGNPERNRVMFLLTFLVGLRVCNLQKLQIADIYDDKGKVFDKIVLNGSKNKFGSVCEYYLNDEMKKELTNYRKWLKSVKPNLNSNDYLLMSNKTGKCLAKESIVRIFRQVYDSVGLTQCRSHSGRRSFITNLCNKGIGIQIVSKLVNHRSLSVTMGYYQNNPTTLQNAVNVLGL